MSTEFLDAIAAVERRGCIVERQIMLGKLEDAVESLAEFSRSIAKVVAIYHAAELDESGPTES